MAGIGWQSGDSTNPEACLVGTAGAWEGLHGSAETAVWATGGDTGQRGTETKPCGGGSPPNTPAPLPNEGAQAVAAEDEREKGGKSSEARKNGAQSAPKFWPHPLYSDTKWAFSLNNELRQNLEESRSEAVSNGKSLKEA